MSFEKPDPQVIAALKLELEREISLVIKELLEEGVLGFDFFGHLMVVE